MIAIPNLITLIYKLLVSVGAFVIGFLLLGVFLQNYQMQFLIVSMIFFLISSVGFFYFVLKLRVIVVNKTGIYCFQPLLLTKAVSKKTVILWNKAHKVNYAIKSRHREKNYRQVTIEANNNTNNNTKNKTQNNPKIILTDLDIENFTSLTKYIKNGKNQRDKVNRQFANDLQSYLIFKAMLQFAFIVFYFAVAYQHIGESTFFIIPFYFALLLISSVNKVIWCFKINNNQ